MKTNSIKMGLFYFLGAVLWFAAVEARSDEKVPRETINNYSYSSPSCDPVANAGNEIHFDSSTNDLQIGMGYADCGNGDSGSKVSFGKRICPTCPLLNFSFGQQEGGKPIRSIGTTWKVKW